MVFISFFAFKKYPAFHMVLTPFHFLIFSAGLSWSLFFCSSFKVAEE